MTAVTVRELKTGSSPARIAVQSTEGDMYLCYVLRGDGLQQVVSDSGKTLKARSIAQMHAQLRDVPIGEARLMLNTPYDEMIGLETCSGVEGIPLAW